MPLDSYDDVEVIDLDEMSDSDLIVKTEDAHDDVVFLKSEPSTTLIWPPREGEIGSESHPIDLDTLDDTSAQDSRHENCPDNDKTSPSSLRDLVMEVEPVLAADELEIEQDLATCPSLLANTHETSRMSHLDNFIQDEQVDRMDIERNPAIHLSLPEHTREILRILPSDTATQNEQPEQINVDIDGSADGVEELPSKRHLPPTARSPKSKSSDEELDGVKKYKTIVQEGRILTSFQSRMKIAQRRTAAQLQARGQLPPLPTPGQDQSSRTQPATIASSSGSRPPQANKSSAPPAVMISDSETESGIGDDELDDIRNDVGDDSDYNSEKEYRKQAKR
jgi:hypothetical protein